jgi:hypothetical protein
MITGIGFSLWPGGVPGLVGIQLHDVQYHVKPESA